jgi:glycosyltransferase involved in cell wall biosynthesis
MIIGVVTPSYLRARLLKRFLRRMPRQTFRDWRLVVVHDGPAPEVEAIVGRARAGDSRMAYAHTERTARDYGVSPRIEGVRHLMREVGPDYCVFWDDDNYFSRHALARIVDAIEGAGRPDLLLVPIRLDTILAPPRGVPIEELTWGQIDTGCLVVRPRLALEGYQDILDCAARDSCAVGRNTDFRVFQYIRDRKAGCRIELASCRPIGIHDGLRTPVYIRGILGIPPLGLAPRILRRDRWSR